MPTTSSFTVDQAKYAPLIDEILYESDLKTISTKKIRLELQKRLGYDLTPHKAELNVLIGDRFDIVNAQKGGHLDVGTNGVTSPHTNGTKSEVKSPTPPPPHSLPVDDPVHKSPKPPKKQKSPTEDEDAKMAARLQAEWNQQARSTRTGKSGIRKKPAVKKKSKTKVDSSDQDGSEPPKKKRKVNENNPFNAKMYLSQPLAEVVGAPEESRPQVVKQIWAYVKSNGLQDSKDKRYINCDDKLRAVFNSQRVHMFTMNKLLKNHIYPKNEVTVGNTTPAKVPAPTPDTPTPREADSAEDSFMTDDGDGEEEGSSYE